MTRRRARAAPDALTLYAAYRDIRRDYAPPECNAGPQCWVRDGPPSITGHGNGHRGTRCLGCGGKPRPPIVTRRPR